MEKDYLSIQITLGQAAEIASDFYNIKGEIYALAGEIDFNFKIKTEQNKYLLKISRPKADENYIDFQNSILEHASEDNAIINSPKVLKNKDGDFHCKIKDANGNIRFVRLLTWMDGRLWSQVNPINDKLLIKLGKQAGMLTNKLQNFDHNFAHRNFDWDIANAKWTLDFTHLFNEEKKQIADHFLLKFLNFQNQYNSLRQSVVHNDVNDNNIIVSHELINPDVTAIIDFGDAIYTKTINDLAITIAYAAMHKTDALSAAVKVIEGYNEAFPLKEEELEFLYVLVAMRLIISVSKSAINKEKEPDNKYLLISEKPAWDVLRKWFNINEDFAHYSFRKACGFTAHPHENNFIKWADDNKISLSEMLGLEFSNITQPDFSIGSTFLGTKDDYSDNELFAFKMQQLRKTNPNTLFAGGYMEARPFYTSDAYKKIGNSGPEYRSLHLGTDIWINKDSEIYSPYKGVVFSISNNNFFKDYGPTLITKHHTNTNQEFYCLFGHLSLTSLSNLHEGQNINKGDLLAKVGNPEENGSWAPHLHFQLILSMLGNKNNFPGVCYPNQEEVWKNICPDPKYIFRETIKTTDNQNNTKEVISYRKEHLGKSLSLSYDPPLQILRGEGVYLIDKNGRKYLDTVNNVAHVGHENPDVVRAGREQMSVLNTNTRYLNNNINEFAEELLSTFPEELSVVHLVNSGSEANELALRMAQACTGQKDIIAVEVGYHGNTGGCIAISSYKFDGKGGKGAPKHTHIVPLPDTFRGLYRGKDAGEKYAAHVQKQIENIKAKGRKPAAFMCESIVSCGGQIELPKDYLKNSYDFVRSAGGICIADEVQVGCGRMGSKFWGFQLHDVIPDIVTIGKPIGNGHPLAAVVCTKKVAEAFANGMEYFNTFGGNPVSCAIGKEVLKVIKRDNLQENALITGNYLKDKLKHMQEEIPIIRDVRGQGLFLGIEFTDTKKKPLTNKVKYIANRMKDLGILMSVDGKDNNVLKIKPPIIFSRENADELLANLAKVCKEDYVAY